MANPTLYSVPKDVTSAPAEIPQTSATSPAPWPFWCALATIVALSGLLFAQTLQLGFLLDDFFHVDYLVRAFNGQPEALYRLLWSNWSADTTLTSYRPLVSFSLAADYALWNINAFGYHLTNILMFCGCTLLVGLTGRELASVFKLPNRRGIALLASALFATYPLHPEAVAWIIGRVDLLCGLLTLLSFYGYLLHRRTNANSHLALTVVSFVLALMSKEMAVTLPVATTLLELVAPTAPASGRLKFRLTKSLLWLWGTLFAFAAYRTFILGTVVGGYGGSGSRVIKQGIKNFLDQSTALKLLFGASEEFPISDTMRGLTLISIATLVGLGVSRFKLNWRWMVFLGGWTVITILPTFQIWHIWPNLVGSRLFFLGSAPLCLMLAFAAGCCKGVRLVAGVSVALALSAMWMVTLVTNLQAWDGAAKQFGEFQSRISSYLPKLTGDRKLLIPVLPQDYKGAPVLGRPEYLAVMTKPPFANRDYTANIVTLEPMIAGGAEVVSPSLYKSAKEQSDYAIELADEASKPLYGRLTETGTVAPSVKLTPPPPLTLKDRFDWLHTDPHRRTVLSYDASQIPNAAFAKVYISKPWTAFTNAARPVQPDPQNIEIETDRLPLTSTFTLPKLKSKGVHDVAVMTFDKDGKPIGNLSEALPIHTW